MYLLAFEENRLVLLFIFEEFLSLYYHTLNNYLGKPTRISVVEVQFPSYVKMPWLFFVHFPMGNFAKLAL